ncbi:trace amine-associated receptor 1-like [Antennarius striatus]|uniref:trace amine-associated receptor 1-like n=1 Tax=Antennarius striatus TaxID=241820 RepID=UPI0035AEE870
MDLKATVNGSYTVDHMHPCYEFDRISYVPVFIKEISIMCALLYFFLGLLAVVITCGNLLVIISIVYFKQLRTSTNYLILSLAVADLLVGMLVFPFSMAFTLTSCWYHEDLFCKVRGGVDTTLSQASILHLCCISIDRYYVICQPLTYKSKVNDRSIGIMILMIWTISIVIGIGIAKVDFNKINCEDGCLLDVLLASIVSTIFCFYIPVIIMLSIYLKVFLVAKRQANSIQTTACQDKKSRITVSKMERKATKTLAIVMGVFFLCWTPFFLCIFFQPLTYDVTPVVVLETFYWLALSNSMLNPFIYAFFYSWFRSAFRIIISGKILQGDFVNSKLF